MSNSPEDHALDEQRAILCPTCLHANPPGTDRCDSCIRVLEGIETVPLSVVRRVHSDRRRRRRRRLLIRLGALVAVLAGLAAWQAFEFYGFVRFIGAPVTRVSAAPISEESMDWPMYQRDPLHSGYHPLGDLTPSGEVIWSFDMGTEVTTSPAVVDGTVYLGAGLRGVVALDAQTGDLLWQFPVLGVMETNVAVAGDKVFAGLRDGRIVALDRRSGELAWEVQTGNKVFSSPAILDGIVYVGSGDSFLYVIDAETGVVRWRFDAGDSIVAAPAVSEEVLAFTAQDRKLYVVETFSGKLRFDYRLDYVGGAPSIRGDRVYLGDEAGILRSIDWHQRTLPFERAFARLRFYGWWYGLASLDHQKGFVWGFSPPGAPPLGTAVATDELVYVPAATGRLYAVDVATGEEVWSFRAAGRMNGAPTVIGDTVVIGDTQGRLYGLRDRTGEQLWELRGLGGPVESSPVIAGGTIYVTTGQGRLLAIR